MINWILLIHVLGTNYFIARSLSSTLLDFESAAHISDSWYKTHCIACGCRQNHLSLVKTHNHFLTSLVLIFPAFLALIFQNFNFWVWVFACMRHSSPKACWSPQKQECVRSCETGCIIVRHSFGFWESKLSLLKEQLECWTAEPPISSSLTAFLCTK